MVVLAFGVIFGLVKFRSSAPVKSANTPQVAVNVQPKLGPTSTTDVSKETVNTVSTSEPTSVRSSKGSAIKAGYRPSLGKATTPKQSPVKLMPGERSYLQTIAKLDSTIKEGQKDMRPALQVEYERNLAVVDRAIAATRSEAKKNPNDPDAADFMFAAYQSKVDLLNTIADARVYNRTH
jgi:hypothetical protein